MNNKNTPLKAIVIGAGLAGTEASLNLSKNGVEVDLYEMRPKKMTKAHTTDKCAELVCSNSLRGASLSNAVGLLKEELRVLNSFVIKSADINQVPAGGALAVDREKFSTYLDNQVRNNKNINFFTKEIETIPQVSDDTPIIIATGPLTSESFSKSIMNLINEKYLSFYDAISPIVTADSINYDYTFRQSRYDKGNGDDYINIPFTKEEYIEFVNDINSAEKLVPHHDVDENLHEFEGCMPIEDMAKRGENALRFGPCKPVGLTDPRTGIKPYAVMQLRKDNLDGSLLSLVGMQTRMTYKEQQRIFKKIKAFENAEFVRLGSVHRNTFMNSPLLLNNFMQLKKKPNIFFAGQITGTEGYVEAIAGGVVSSFNAYNFLTSKPLKSFPLETAIGSLINYISCEENAKNFQPMNVNFGLMPDYVELNMEAKKNKIGKLKRREDISKRALKVLNEFKNEFEFFNLIN